MEKLSNKETWIVDDTIIDLLVQDTQVDRVQVQDQNGEELGRPRFIISVDPYSRFTISCELSCEEM